MKPMPLATSVTRKVDVKVMSVQSWSTDGRPPIHLPVQSAGWRRPISQLAFSLQPEALSSWSQTRTRHQ
jgi:hypothetical protein